jgi:hypothetical protein
VARQKVTRNGQASNANNRRPRSSPAGTSSGTVGGARGKIAAGLAMSRRARPRNGAGLGLVKGLGHATPLHLLHPRLRRLKPPISGAYRETHYRRHKRKPMMLWSPRRGPLSSGLAPLHIKRGTSYSTTGCSFHPRRRQDGVKLHVLSTAGGIFWASRRCWSGLYTLDREFVIDMAKRRSVRVTVNFKENERAGHTGNR